MKVAVLGTGKMGAAIVRRLDRSGFEVAVWNRTRARAEAVGAGTVHDTVPAAAEHAEVVVTCVTDAPAVRAVYADLTPGKPAYLEMSTAGPEVAEELAGRFPTLLAAPIVAPPARMEQGEARVLVGGGEEAYRAARPVLDAMGAHQHVGTPRRAALMKLLNNAMLAVTVAAGAELTEAAVRAGLTPEEAFGFVKTHAPYLENRKSGYLGGPYEPLTFRLLDQLKDVDYALQALDGPGFPMPILETVRGQFAEVAGDHGEEELTAVLEAYRRR